jgi:hypothetical protein
MRLPPREHANRNGGRKAGRVPRQYGTNWRPVPVRPGSAPGVYDSGKTSPSMVRKVEQPSDERWQPQRVSADPARLSFSSGIETRTGRTHCKRPSFPVASGSKTREYQESRVLYLAVPSARQGQTEGGH